MNAKSPDIMDESSPSAVNSVVKILEDRIYSGVLPHGEMLPAERELIEEFSISRTVVREAVKVLSARGLVESLPRHRPVVKRPGYDTALGVMGGMVKYLVNEPGGVWHLFNTRIFVEAGLVRHAAASANKDDIANLREALAANEAAIQDSQKFYQTDMAFHGVLYTISDNPIFPTLHRSFCDWLADHWERMPRLPERNKRNYVMHANILEGILNRDADGAERALRGHLQESWSQVEATFDNL